MNNRIELPELDSDSLGIWLTLLADRELSGDAHRELTEFLDRNPQHWRDCAIALWDESSLRSAYRESGGMSSASKRDYFSGQHGELEISADNDNQSRIQVAAIAVANPDHNGSFVSQVAVSGNGNKMNTERRFQRMSKVRWCAAAAVLTMVFSAVWFTNGRFGSVRPDENTDRLLAEIGELKTITSNLAAGWAAEKSTLRSVADLFPEAPMLLEIESTPWRTVYLSDRPASDQMISTLASMSDKVTVKPFEPEIVTPLWRSLNRPVVSIEVMKSDFPLLTGVQK